MTPGRKNLRQGLVEWGENSNFAAEFRNLWQDKAACYIASIYKSINYK